MKPTNQNNLLNQMAHSKYTVKQLKEALRGGEFTELGGYPTYFITSDGDSISHEGVRQNFRTIIDAMTDESDRSGWAVVGQDINWEDYDMFCCHTNKRIPSAYAEPETEL